MLLSMDGALDDDEVLLGQDVDLLGHPQVRAQLQAMHVCSGFMPTGPESSGACNDDGGQSSGVSDVDDEAAPPSTQVHVSWSDPLSSLDADVPEPLEEETPGMRAETIRFMLDEAITKLRNWGCSLEQVELFFGLMAEREPIPSGAIEAGLHRARELYAFVDIQASTRADAAVAPIASSAVAPSGLTSVASDLVEG